ncbi:MAG: cardiolipin synthase [Lentisphaerae bacterium]|nr:cardiolipin synthase [Lentisphaerota bacterium]
MFDIDITFTIPEPIIVLGTLMHVAAFLLVCTHCLQRRREATATLLWMFVAWSFPLIGPLIYLTMGVDRVPRKAWRKHVADRKFLAERRAREDAELPLAYWRSVHETGTTLPHSPLGLELDKAMTNILPDYPLLGGNRIRALVTGDEAFPLMLEAIRAACHHVHLQTFIIRNDAVGRDFMALLAEKAAEGVRIRFLYDRFGSSHAIWTGLFRRYRTLPNFSLSGWTQANMFKRQFQLNLRNHRKVLVVDGAEAFIGGINLQIQHTSRAGSPPIQDYHFHLHGPIVQELQYTFLRDWYFMTDEDPEELLHKNHFPHLDRTGGAQVRVVNSGPTEDEKEAIAETFFLLLTAARKSILAVTPYFIPTTDLLHAFRSAALRGLEVRLVLPEFNNHFYAGLAGQALYESLLDAGVRIFERPPPFMHAKALIVDDTVAFVGTANLDARSLRLNYESNLAVYEPGFIADLRRVIVEEELAKSRELRLDTWRARPGHRKLLENFFSLMAPVV